MVVVEQMTFASDVDVAVRTCVVAVDTSCVVGVQMVRKKRVVVVEI